MSWQDAVAKVGVEPTYPFVQWINDGSILSPRAKSGGFAMPEAEAAVAGDSPKNAVKATARFRTADEAVFFVPQIRAAILAVRFSWTKDGVPVQGYVEGARGKAKALAVVEGNNGPFLAVMTFSGLASRDFLSAWKEHKARVRKATRAAGQEAPASIFYMTLQAGETQKMAQGSIRTPMALLGDFDPDKDYIGDRTFQTIDWEAVRSWESGNGYANGEPEEPEASPPEPIQPEVQVDAPAPSAPDHDWAMNYPCPVPGRTFKAGTPLKDLPGQALEYLVRNGQRWPEAATAAGIVLDIRRRPEEDLPF